MEGGKLLHHRLGRKRSVRPIRLRLVSFFRYGLAQMGNPPINSQYVSSPTFRPSGDFQRTQWIRSRQLR